MMANRRWLYCHGSQTHSSASAFHRQCKRFASAFSYHRCSGNNLHCGTGGSSCLMPIIHAHAGMAPEISADLRAAASHSRLVINGNAAMAGVMPGGDGDEPCAACRGDAADIDDAASNVVLTVAHDFARDHSSMPHFSKICRNDTASSARSRAIRHITSIAGFFGAIGD